MLPLIRVDEMAQSLAQAQQGGVPWWIWFLALLVVVYLVWWFFRKPGTEEKPPESTHLQSTAVAPEPTAEASSEDDLEIIEGIGPKIKTLLKTAGILTFAQLAEADTPRLRQILEAAGLRIADPETWPEQARLAAQKDWDGLKNLQDRLKGGRKV